MVQVFNTYLKEGKPVLEEERKLPADIHFITGEKELYAFCKGTLKLHLYAEEYLYAISVNAKGKIQGVFEISHGTVNTSLAGTREIMQKLLLLGSVDFYLAHNHPSQDPSPSDIDISVTERVYRAGELLGIRLVDHMIITEKDYYSLYRKFRFWIRIKKTPPLIEHMFEQQGIGHDNRTMVRIRRLKNLPHQTNRQKGRHHSENNPYPEGHPRSYGECPQVSFLRVDSLCIFCAVPRYLVSW